MRAWLEQCAGYRARWTGKGVWRDRSLHSCEPETKPTDRPLEGWSWAGGSQGLAVMASQWKPPWCHVTAVRGLQQGYLRGCHASVPLRGQLGMPLGHPTSQHPWPVYSAHGLPPAVLWEPEPGPVVRWAGRVGKAEEGEGAIHLPPDAALTWANSQTDEKFRWTF